MQNIRQKIRIASASIKARSTGLQQCSLRCSCPKTPATPPQHAPHDVRRGATADLYQLEEQVGRGSFGVVHRARVKGTKDQVAIKIVDLEADVSELEAVKSEVETMASATACPQLVRYLGCHMVQNRLWIVTEYLGGGSLGDLMAKTKRPLPEEAVAE